ncbi:zincin-like metallopeptidase domain-containing protein [Pontiellaceae bacterium B12227]|nr:zincin-like metallopeptidase domain-containing protein [Pontiellaceae bacterium B12227]
MSGRDKINGLITQKMIDRITELGELPWRKPWTSASMWPRNLISQKRYRGCNVFLLHSLGYASPYFLTMKQANTLGGKIRKGEKACPVVFWKMIDPEDKNAPKDDPASKCRPILRYYSAFNVDQCEGIPEEKIPSVEIPARNVYPIAAAEEVVRGMPNPPKIIYGRSQASYAPSFDTVQMPNPEWFESDEHFYSCLYHELAHSTGHESRLARKAITSPNGFGSNPYAREELVAEMTAAFLCGQCGILNAVEGNSAAYLKGWLQRLHEDPSLLISAGSMAQRAFDYIVDIQWEEKTAAMEKPQSDRIAA